MMNSTSRIDAIRRHARDLCYWVNPAVRRRIADWECADGVEFLRNLGIAPGDVVLDFGSGPGHYSVPAACVVGKNGLVCAVDENAHRRRRLERRARSLNMSNVRTVAQLDDAPGALGGRRCDAVLAYDVLHIMDTAERLGLYRQFRELMSERGVFSVHPKHLRDDEPRRHFQDMTLDDLAKEITEAGFRLRDRVACTLWHDRGPVSGTLLNFGLSEGPAAGQETR